MGFGDTSTCHSFPDMYWTARRRLKGNKDKKQQPDALEYVSGFTQTTHNESCSVPLLLPGVIQH